MKHRNGTPFVVQAWGSTTDEVIADLEKRYPFASVVRLRPLFLGRPM